MEFYIHNKHINTENEEIGNPSLLYTGLISKELPVHPRSMHSHSNSVEMQLMLEDDGEFLVDGKLYPVSKGDLVIYNSNVLHDELPFGGNQPSVVYCAATGIQIEGLPKNHLLPAGVSPILKLGEKSRAFKNLLQIMFDESYRENRRSYEICHSLFTAFFRMVLNEINFAEENNIVSPEINNLGAKIKAFINSNYLKPLTVKNVADEFEISISYLSHVFKNATGQTLIQYIMQRRIGEAQTWLISTNEPVKKIAVMVGYDNVSYFNTLFTRSVGTSPLKYRKNYKNINYSYSNLSQKG